MSAARKITARGYRITARANVGAALREQQAEAAKLDAAIAANLKELGYGP